MDYEKEYYKLRDMSEEDIECQFDSYEQYALVIGECLENATKQSMGHYGVPLSLDSVCMHVSDFY